MQIHYIKAYITVLNWNILGFIAKPSSYSAAGRNMWIAVMQLKEGYLCWHLWKVLFLPRTMIIPLYSIDSSWLSVLWMQVVFAGHDISLATYCLMKCYNSRWTYNCKRLLRIVPGENAISMHVYDYFQNDASLSPLATNNYGYGCVSYMY